MLRIRQICLVARDLKPAVDALESAFGFKTCFNDPVVADYGLENAVLPVGNDFLEIVAPVEADTAAGRYLDRRGGDGGYIVILQCDDALERRARAREIGIRIANTIDHGDFFGTQLHPRDTGGSMLEVDWNLGGGAPDSPWTPAGGDWRDKMRTDKITAMTGAELQSDYPAELAARWGHILDVMPETNHDGGALLRLDNAILRFVPATDGRGDGLSGVEFKAAPGNPQTGETVTVCGTRFRLT
ncbi:MAG: VOC family protein [Alphaproteobacteria bacterium]|jgi:hypothetical protein